MISVELLQKQHLFKDLPIEILTRAASLVQLREYGKGRLILKEGEIGNALLLLIAGGLQVITLSERGKEVGLNFLEPGDHFGEISLIDQLPRSASIITIKKSVIGVLPRDHALWLFRNQPLVAERIQRRLCQVIRQEVERRSNQSGAKAYNRIYSIIFQKQVFSALGSQKNNSAIAGSKFNTNTSPVTVLEKLPDQKVIASMANVSRETVSRAIQALIRAGVIQKQARQILIKDPVTLHRLASGELAAKEIIDQEKS